ncbi:MAG: hypothetical protein AAFP89_27305 [Bacteroidota bacterium]
MTFVELWNASIEEDFEFNYVAMEAVFSKSLPQEVKDEYDVGELLVDFEGTCVRKWRFDWIEGVRKLLKVHHPELFQEMLPYYNHSLISYHCYHEEEENLRELVEDFLIDPVEHADFFFAIMWKLLFCQHNDLVKEIVERAYPDISESDSLLPDSGLRLTLLKFLMEQERIYENYLSTGKFEWEPFNSIMKDYGLDISPSYNRLFEKGIEHGWEKLADDMPKGQNNIKTKGLAMLELPFNLYMKEKGFSFSLSGTIWQYIGQYWMKEGKGNNFQSFVRLDPKKFKEFLRGQAGSFIDYRFFTVMILWGSSYVYDFFFKAKLIDEAKYAQSRTVIHGLKKELIAENLADLWEYNFVNTWPKADMSSEEERKEEVEIFRKYYGADRKEVSQKQQKGFFIDPNFNFDDFFAPELGAESTFKPRQKLVTTVRRDRPKIGRNERITVKYLDGRIIENIKYKKVEADIESGECEIMEGDG